MLIDCIKLNLESRKPVIDNCATIESEAYTCATSEYISDTLDHMSTVAAILKTFGIMYDSELNQQDAIDILLLSQTHDSSKLYNREERALYIKLSINLKDVKYGTPEYFDIMSRNDVIQLHYKNNKHHPEHYEGGIYDMSPVYLLEMLADWMASHYRKSKAFDAAFNEYLEFNRKRFNINDELFIRIENTFISLSKNIKVVPNIFEYIK